MGGVRTDTTSCSSPPVQQILAEQPVWARLLQACEGTKQQNSPHGGSSSSGRTQTINSEQFKFRIIECVKWW